MALKSFEIKVEKLPVVYAPGEIITGKVFVSLNKKKTCRGIKLKFEGKARVHWNDSWIGDRNSNTEVQQYFEKEFYVVGSSNGEMELVAGQHIFPFIFPLPVNIPNSFYHRYGQVEYDIEAVIERALAVDYKTYLPFKIDSPLGLSQAPSMPIVDRVHHEYGRCDGHMEAHIRIPRRAVGIGDQFEVLIDIEMILSSVKVMSIDVQLEQFLAGSSTKSSSAIVQSAAKKGPFPGGTNVKLEFQVPKVHPSGLQHCSIIRIMYCLGVKMISSDYSNSISERKYQIEIGPKSIATTQRPEKYSTSPALPTAPMDGLSAELPTSSTSSAPPLPVPENREYEAAFEPIPHHPPPYDSLPPIGFVIANPSAPVEPTSAAEPPPPSYESIMAQEGRM